MAANRRPLFPDWCDPNELGPLTDYCELAYGRPIWSFVMVADVVAVWMIFCIVWRRMQQKKLESAAKLAVPKHLRAKRYWGVLSTMVRLASGAKLSMMDKPDIGEVKKGAPLSPWARGWQKVLKIRSDRRDYLMRKDFDLAAVIAKGMGAVLIVAMSALILFELHGFVFLALPWWELGAQVDSAWHLVSGIIIFRIFLDYGRCTWTDPGRPTEEDFSRWSECVAPQNKVKSKSDKAEQRDYCKTCSGPKPARTHHCKVCRRCVLKMDHHCPFIANCVGMRNYQYFICFLLELAISCFIIALCMLPQVPAAVYALMMHRYYSIRWAAVTHILAVFLVALIAAFCLGPFFYFHMTLLAHNETTLEFMKRRAVRASGKGVAQSNYSRGNLENFTEVCGAPPWYLRRPILAFMEHLVEVKTDKRSASPSWGERIGSMPSLSDVMQQYLPEQLTAPMNLGKKAT